MKFPFPGGGRLFLACLLLISSGLSARAQISFVDIYRTALLTQTGDDAAGTAYSFSYIGLDLNSETGNEYSTVRAFYPGPDSPVTLVNDNPNNNADYQFTSATFTSQAALDAAYPKGPYSFTATGGGPDATTMVSYMNDAYPATQPYLTGSNFSALQGMNSAAGFTFQLSPFVKDASATDAFIFFNIFDVATGNVVFTSNFLSPNTTSVSMPGNTLHPNTAYVFDLDYSDRVTVDSPGADFDGILGFDVRTEGNFTTAVPEPGVSALALIGATTFLLRRKRRSNVK